MDKLLKTLLAAAIVLVAASCAKEPSEDNSGVQDKLIKAWVEVNYPDKLNNTTVSGTYVLEYKQGTGRKVVDSSYVFIHYVKKDLEGNIIGTNIQKYADQIGTFAQGDDYGCDIWQMGVQAIYLGIEEVLRDLRVGGHAVLGVPASLATCEYNVYNAFPGDENLSFIFELTLEQVEDDIYKYQEKALKEYSSKYYGGMDTVGQGFYFIDQTDPATKTDTISDGASIKVWYVGRRLDGSVFDTNIQDTAKKYRLYDAKASYDPLEVTWHKDPAETKDADEVVAGFAYALNKMQYGSTATTFFWSTLGYGASGQSPKIGEYSPLVFTLSIKPND